MIVMGQKLVVSTNRYEYSGYKCVSSLQNIDWKSVDVLIYNRAKDGDVDAILELSKACDVVPVLIYINRQINSLFYGIFAGANGDIYDDEDMLNQEDVLDFLVSDYKKTGMTMKSPSADVETIAKFISSVSMENAEALSKMINNSVLVQTLQNSIKSVETSLVRTDEANEEMIKMFNKTSEIIDVLKSSQDKTTQKIEELSQFLTKVEQSSSVKGSNIINFPTFQVPNTVQKVFYIQVFSPCRYLVSFISFYQHYLKYQKQVNAKILIAVPRLKQFIKKYEDFTRLAPETINNRGISNNEIFVTHEPKAQVLSAFFNMKADMYIVVDMMFGEPLLAGAKVNKFSAVTAISDIKRYGVDPTKCIISTYGVGQNIVIPRISKYGYINVPGKPFSPELITGKRTKYFDACGSKAYLQLDKLLGIL